VGDIAIARLGESGVDLSHVTSREGVGTGVTVLLPHGQRRHILTYLGAMAEMTVADLDLAYLTSSRHFHLSSPFLQTGLHHRLFSATTLAATLELAPHFFRHHGQSLD
jgi:sugar/nucleoside kinase (ribokinase family)